MILLRMTRIIIFSDLLQYFATVHPVQVFRVAGSSDSRSQDQHRLDILVSISTIVTPSVDFNQS